MKRSVFTVGRIALAFGAVVALLGAWHDGYAADDLICPAVMLCDENGRYLPGVDPASPCAQAQERYCSGLRFKAEETRASAMKMRFYSKRYGKCLKWVEKVSRTVRLEKRAARAKVLRVKTCAKYSRKIRKLQLAAAGR
jgi:hypothetical protein